MNLQELTKHAASYNWSPEFVSELRNLEPADWDEIAAITGCGHRNKTLRAMSYVCDDCGRSITEMMQTQDEAATALLGQVHQGIVPKDWAIETAKGQGYAGEYISLLQAVIPCMHLPGAREVAKCCGSSDYREKCTVCTRIFTNPAQFVLEHKESEHGS
jgi:ribulose kinase